MRRHDHSCVEPDGTLVNVTEARTLVLGLPVARRRRGRADPVCEPDPPAVD